MSRSRRQQELAFLYLSWVHYEVSQGRRYWNFFCSQDYYDALGIQMRVLENHQFQEVLFYPVDSFSDQPFSPVLAATSVDWERLKVRISAELLEGIREKKGVDYWAGLPHHSQVAEGERFLDFNYFYRPGDFFGLGGKKWKTLRKNLRKSEGKFDFRYLGNPVEAGMEVLEKWASKKGLLEDVEPVVWYFLNKPEQVQFLFQGDRPVAVAVWDFLKAPTYANFRYCFTDPDFDEFCVSERMRVEVFRFLSLMGCKLVNDGGSMGDEHLSFFKERLNPVLKLVVPTKE